MTDFSCASEPKTERMRVVVVPNPPVAAAMRKDLHVSRKANRSSFSTLAATSASMSLGISDSGIVRTHHRSKEPASIESVVESG
jgi:hypothetical protein